MERSYSEDGGMLKVMITRIKGTQDISYEDIGTGIMLKRP
jgi:hypothetical protein